MCCIEGYIYVEGYMYRGCREECAKIVHVQWTHWSPVHCNISIVDVVQFNIDLSLAIVIYLFLACIYAIMWHKNCKSCKAASGAMHSSHMYESRCGYNIPYLRSPIYYYKGRPTFHYQFGSYNVKEGWYHIFIISLVHTM